MAYVVNGSAMLCSLNNLDGDIVADVECKVGHKRDLWKAERGARVFRVGWARNLERRDHWMRHVGRCDFSRAVDADVDVEHRGLVAYRVSALFRFERTEQKSRTCEPPRLNSKCAARDRP